jgi:hypothetical protein
MPFSRVPPSLHQFSTKLFLVRPSTHRWGVYSRPKYEYFLNLTLWTTKFYWCYLKEYGRGWFTGEIMTQRQLHHENPPQHSQKLRTQSILNNKHTLGSSAGEESSKWVHWYKPLPSSHYDDFCFFQISALVSHSSVQLGLAKRNSPFFAYSDSVGPTE